MSNDPGDEVWYEPILDAFIEHQEKCHIGRDIQDEIRWFEESLFYENWKDDETNQWGCCWVDCEWKVKFTTQIKLKFIEIKETKK